MYGKGEWASWECALADRLDPGPNCSKTRRLRQPRFRCACGTPGPRAASQVFDSFYIYCMTFGSSAFV